MEAALAETEREVDAALRGATTAVRELKRALGRRARATSATYASRWPPRATPPVGSPTAPAGSSTASTSTSTRTSRPAGT
ncbi:hypothetical protein Psuf_038790 [Phytohabitans suffuscus]|uniref:Uncharacterized protein n=1 Tax=Phytohabitans suffuscus TaxID=624315 RepID=A0A6F8YKH1_9ACTN|nr:hypothetical protein Psuf_038790 [Phytohabitans suffuscus]